jgi:hypothetical protein
MLQEIFEFAGLFGFTCLCLAVVFIKMKKFKLHKLFAMLGFASIVIHVTLRFLFLK